MFAGFGDGARLGQRLRQRVMRISVVVGEPQRFAKLRDRTRAVAVLQLLPSDTERKGGRLGVGLSTREPVRLGLRTAGAFFVSTLREQLREALMCFDEVRATPDGRAKLGQGLVGF